MEYVYTFKMIEYGRVKIDADNEPRGEQVREEIKKAVLGGAADFFDTKFKDFELIEVTEG